MKLVPVRFRRVRGWHRGRRSFEAPELSGLPEEPLVSCLCVTQDRHAFVPWLLWAFDRQEWKRRELVIVDSSKSPIEVPSRKDVRVLRMPHGASLGKKRNLALRAARGEVVAWFDDDDWQHPKRLSTLVPLLAKSAAAFGASFIGPSRSWFLDIAEKRCRAYEMSAFAIFNGSIFYTHMVRHAVFREDVRRGEDTRWLCSLFANRQGAALEGNQPTLFFWLSHENNVTNRSSVRRLFGDVNEMRRDIGWAWRDTSHRLAELRTRLLAVS